MAQIEIAWWRLIHVWNFLCKNQHIWFVSASPPLKECWSLPCYGRSSVTQKCSLLTCFHWEILHVVSLHTLLPSFKQTFVFKVSDLLRGKLSHGLYLNRKFCLNLRICNVNNKIDIWIKCFCLYLETQKLFSPDLVWHR